MTETYFAEAQRRSVSAKIYAFIIRYAAINRYAFIIRYYKPGAADRSVI